jgi:hypothetical protein
MMRSRHSKKEPKVLLSAALGNAMLLLIFFLVPDIAVSDAKNDPEAQAVMQAATTYLNAELRRDYAAVYSCFAPSSDYVRLKNYKQYLEEVNSAGQQVVRYRIINISYIEKNSNRLLSADIEKIAEVVTDVTLANKATGKRTAVNIGFIFFKEKGKWYKS